MVGKIAPLVQGNPHESKILMAHLAGGLVGGCSLGLICAWLGALLHSAFALLQVHSQPLIILSAFALLVGGLMDLRLVPSLRVTQRQTPASWTCSLGETWGVFGWGVDLGFGLAVRPASSTALALPVAALGVEHGWQAVLLMGTFGATRSLSTVAIVRIARTRFATANSLISSHVESTSNALGFASVTLATAWLLGQIL